MIKCKQYVITINKILRNVLSMCFNIMIIVTGAGPVLQYNNNSCRLDRSCDQNRYKSNKTKCKLVGKLI